MNDKGINAPSRKGIFIPGITVEMFRNASLEGVEELMTSGEIEDISLPSAQPERKTGRWIPHEDEDGEHYGDKCSECGEWYVMPYGKTNFCPNCGANMRGEQDE